MQEIANRFKEEYTELLSRYKEHLTNTQIMSILQSVTRKQIGIKDNPERFRGLSYAPGFPIVDLEGTWRYVGDVLNKSQVPQHHCSTREIVKAGCDGDIYKCKNACGKLRMNKTTVSDYQGADRHICDLPNGQKAICKIESYGKCTLDCTCRDCKYFEVI